MKTYKEILVESSLSRIHQHTQDRNIGMITGHRVKTHRNKIKQPIENWKIILKLLVMGM